jgi:lipopolysaccharide transport system ATP-binding protein
VGDVINQYLNINKGLLPEKFWEDADSAPGNQHVRLRRIRVVPALGAAADPITVRTPLDVECEFWNFVAGSKINLSLVLWTATGQCAFNIYSPSVSLKRGVHRGVCKIPANLLNDETYLIDVYIVKDTSVVLHKETNVVAFKVEEVEREGAWFGKHMGVVRPELDFSIGEVFHE